MKHSHLRNALTVGFITLSYSLANAPATWAQTTNRGSTTGLPDEVRFQRPSRAQPESLGSWFATNQTNASNAGPISESWISSYPNPISNPFPGVLFKMNETMVNIQPDLTDDQVEELTKQRNDFLSRATPLMAELNVKERNLQDLLTATPVDRASIKKSMDDFSALHAELSNLFVDHILVLSAVFNPEQRHRIRQTILRTELNSEPAI